MPRCKMPCVFVIILFIGSGQQSVTGVEASDDANSYWRIRGRTDGACQRGAPVKCGQAVRLTHVNTGKNLHTHHFPSPLSNNQVKLRVCSSYFVTVYFKCLR